MTERLKTLVYLFCALLAAPALAPVAVLASTGGVPANCTGCDLSHMDFQGRDLRSVTWTGVDLQNADLRGADLRGAHLVGADMEHVRMAGAKVNGAKLVGADMEDSDLRSLDFTGADLIGTDFERSNLSGTTFAGDKIVGASFRDSLSQNVNFSNTTLCFRNRDGRVACSDFRGADLRGANFQGAQICDSHDDEDDPAHCWALDAATLRSEGHANLAGARGI